MHRFTLIVGDREFKLARVETLSELLDRKLISLTDLVLPPGTDESVSVARFLAAQDDPGADEAATSADDLWEAWEETDSYAMDDLVSGLLGGITPDEEADRTDPRDELGDFIVSREPREPDDDVPVLDADHVEVLPPGAIDVADESPVATVGEVATPITPRPPRSFVEFVQQKGAAGLDLEIHEERAPTLPHLPRRSFWVLPAVFGLAAALVFGLVYGTVRSGADRQYPTESEVRERLHGVLSDESDDDATTDTVEPVEQVEELDAHYHELRLRSAIPVPLRAFRNVETFRDALFTDIMNSGIPVREIRIEALVLAPTTAEFRRRPEEVNLELRLAPVEGVDGDDALAKTILIIGHYGADAHVRVRRIVIHVRAQDELGSVYEIQGENAVAFFEGKMDLKALDLALIRRTGSTYLLEGVEEAEGEEIP